MIACAAYAGMLGVGVMAAPPGPRALAGAGRDLDPRGAPAVDLALRGRTARQPGHRPGRGTAGRRPPRRRRAAAGARHRAGRPGGGRRRPARVVARRWGSPRSSPSCSPGRRSHPTGTRWAAPRWRSSRAAAGRAPARPTPASSTCSSAMSPPPSSSTPPVDLVVWPEDVIDTDEDFADDPWADGGRRPRHRPRCADDRRHGRGSRPERLPQRGGPHRRRRRDHPALRQGPPGPLRRVRAPARPAGAARRRRAARAAMP